jgi:hypothetical protein
MRILFTIAHYWKPPSLTSRVASQLRHLPVRRARRLGQRFVPHHGSIRRNARDRAQALAQCIGNLHVLFGSPQGHFDRTARSVIAANGSDTAKVDVIVCSSGSNHVLEKLPLPANFYDHQVFEGDARYLSFDCQNALKAGLGNYDFYCFLEDDILLHDPWFFHKLHWFATRFGDHALLQPNRFERSWQGPVRKLYIDETIAVEETASFQDIARDAELTAPCLDTTVTFQRHPNPHSGCYFLSAAQMLHWSRQAYFGARDASFIGPLESGATLGLMKTFNIYKPAIEDASFLEVEHFGDAYLQRRAAEIAPTHSI